MTQIIEKVENLSQIEKIIGKSGVDKALEKVRM